jgi:hypothetical protein
LCADQPKGAYVITADASGLCDEAFLKRTGAPAPTTCQFKAFLQYKNLWGKATISDGPAVGTGGGKNPRELTSPSLDLSKWQGYDIVKPLEMGPLLKDEPDAQFQLSLGRLDNGKMYLFSSATPWVRPDTPLLHTKASKCADGVPFINVPENATDIEITVHNTLQDAYAIHLHGMHFQVMAMSTSTSGRHLLRLMHPEAPVLKDTVSVPAQGSVMLRFMADNPGVWMLNAMSTIARLRGASTAFNVLPSKQTPIPRDVPTQGKCHRDGDFFV